ncbi:MAG: Acetyltransferase YpeA [Firmicutes bacterium ADurb.Bin193]|nr:MAG: Acetyltransferase YpeA [Firmicutes bacterium ADurb.Bin193]
MKIVRFEKSHIDDIIKLEKQCFTAPWTKGMFEDELKNSMAHYFIAIEDEKVVGYAGMWCVADEGHITNIAVSPDYRRRRIGTALLQRLVRTANELGLSVIMLEVRRSNISAISLYKNAGFEVVGLRKGYYQNNNEDAVLMNLTKGLMRND